MEAVTITEWGVVGVIIALVGLLAAVVKPIINLNASIVKLTDQVANILSGLEEFKKRYTSHLNELRAADEKQQKELNDHESRICVLEIRADEKER